MPEGLERGRGGGGIPQHAKFYPGKLRSERNFFDVFTAIKPSVSPLGPFTDRNDTDFLTFSYTSTIEILTLLYTWSLEKATLLQFERSFYE